MEMILNWFHQNLSTFDPRYLALTVVAYFGYRIYSASMKEQKIWDEYAEHHGWSKAAGATAKPSMFLGLGSTNTVTRLYSNPSLGIKNAFGITEIVIRIQKSTFYFNYNFARFELPCDFPDVFLEPKQAQFTSRFGILGGDLAPTNAPAMLVSTHKLFAPKGLELEALELFNDELIAQLSDLLAKNTWIEISNGHIVFATRTTETSAPEELDVFASEAKAAFDAIAKKISIINYKPVGDFNSQLPSPFTTINLLAPRDTVSQFSQRRMTKLLLLAAAMIILSFSVTNQK